MTRRVKITKLPEAGYGRPISEGWTTRYKNGFTGGMFDNKGEGVRKTLTSVPREDANVEAEGGETVVGDFQKDGLDEFYNIEGPRHADGPGVPLKLPESFIFSDTRKMRINDPSLLKIFGKGKGSYTPAALSKQYQLNDYNAKLTDKDVDPLEKETAELMINNNRDKLSKLAIIQEVYLKGGNVPEFAYPYLKKKGIDVSQLATDQDEVNEEQYSRGGNYLPKAQIIGGFNPKDTVGARSVDKIPQGYTPYKEAPNYAYQDTPGQQVSNTTKGNFTVDDILTKKGTYATFHRLAKEAGIADNPEAMRKAAEVLHMQGIMPSKRDVVKVETAAPPAPAPAPANCPEGYTRISDGTCVPEGRKEAPGGAGSGSTVDEYIPPPPPPPKENYDFSGYPSQPFFKSDMVDLYGAAYSLFDNVDIPPTYQRTAAARTINPVLEDPTRAIANRQEGAARQTDAIKAFGRNPSAASSYMQGLAAGDTANIISGVNQRNIGTLNQAQGFNAQMLTNYDRARQMADRQYDVDLATYLQQKANTKAQKRNVFRDKLSQAYTNQADINQINAQEPSYYFDTRLNNTVFTGRPGNESGSSTYTGMPENFRQLPEEERQAYLDEAQLKYQLQRNAFGSNRWGSRFNRNTRR